MSRSDMIYDDIDILYRNFPFLVEKIPPIPGKGTSKAHHVLHVSSLGTFVIRIRILMYPDVSQTHLTCSVTFEENTNIDILHVLYTYPKGYWGFFLYKKGSISIQDIIIYHYISCRYHNISLCIIFSIMIYHVPRRHMISMI